MKRFTVRKKTFVYRNSMILGSPISKKFQMFCIVDHSWQNEHKSLSFRGYQSASHMALASRELRAAFTNDIDAKAVCRKMNELDVEHGSPKSISFNCDNAWGWFDEPVQITGFQK